MFNFREMPLFRVGLAIVLGVVLAEMVGNIPTLVLASVLVCSVAVIGFLHFSPNYRFRYLSTACIHLLFVGLGVQLYQLHDETRATHYVGQLEGTHTYTVLVSKTPQVSTKGFRVWAQVQSVDGQAAIGGLMLYLPPSADTLSYGDVLQIETAIKPIENKAGSTFDFATYAKHKHTTHSAFASNWQLLARNQGSFWQHAAQNALHHCLAAIDRHLPESEERAVGKALLLGYNLDIQDELSSAYRETGATHILAVSGMHVGLLYVVMIWLLSFVPFRSKAWKWTQWALILLTIWSFAFIAGASGSVLRAAMLFSFVSLGKVLSRINNMYNLLAASALVLLAFDSFLIFDVGFQLSYMAVLGILYFYANIYQRWYSSIWIVDRMWQMTALGVAAQLGTLPLTLLYFGQFPVYFWLSGLLAIPSSTFALFAGMGLLLSDAIGWGGEYLGYLFYAGLWLMNQSIYLTKALPFHLIEGIHISSLIAMYLLATIIILGWALFTKQLKYWNWALGMLCITLVSHQIMKLVG